MERGRGGNVRGADKIRAGMGQPLVNEFSWSKSRHEKLSECQRAYYLHYYGSWGGWEETANPEVRQRYVLKKLSNRFSWAGSVVHETIKLALLGLRAGRPVEPARLIERAHQLMRYDFRFSANRGYWQQRQRKEFAGLVEHEYAENVPPEHWKDNWQSAKAALEWFFRSRWMELARSLKPEQWLEVDSRSFEESVFHLEGVKVFALPDFAYVDHDGQPVVVDWKTGRAREGYDEQVLGYALYVSSRYGFPAEKVKASLVYLNDGLERIVQVDREAVDAFTFHFRRSVARMRELLADPAANVPKAEAHFPMTDNLATCARCVFRRACGREAAAVVQVA